MNLIDKDELAKRINTGMNIIEVMQVIIDMPVVEQRKTGRWRPVQIGKWHGFECTACKLNREVPCSFNGVPQWKYCPDCGSRMEA